MFEFQQCMLGPDYKKSLYFWANCVILYLHFFFFLDVLFLNEWLMVEFFSLVTLEIIP